MEIPPFVQELMVSLQAEIRDDQEKTRAKIDWLLSGDEYGDERNRERRAKNEWAQHRMRVQPLHEHYDYMVKQVAALAAMEPPPPIIITADGFSQAAPSGTRPPPQ